MLADFVQLLVVAKVLNLLLQGVILTFGNLGEDCFECLDARLSQSNDLLFEHARFGLGLIARQTFCFALGAHLINFLCLQVERQTHELFDQVFLLLLKICEHLRVVLVVFLLTWHVLIIDVRVEVLQD